MSPVYIIGAGIHPFGRTEGRSGREQGVFAVRQALADAGLEWADLECAYGGSASSGSADVMVNDLGRDDFVVIVVFHPLTFTFGCGHPKF